MSRIAMFATMLGVTIALPLEAQGRGRGESRTEGRSTADIRLPAGDRSRATDRAEGQGRGRIDVPPGHWPREGRCRVWIDGVPAGRQARETDCATAYRTVPSNGRVLVGRSRTEGRGNDDDDRRGRDERDDRDDRDDRDERNDRDDRETRRFIDRNGLECEEKRVIKDGRRSYDLKCREPKGGRKSQDSSWPPSEYDGYCIDANRDGRCDTGMSRGYPSTLPDMIGAVVFGQGERTDEVARWLGTGRYQVRYTDQNRDKRPERVRWLDSAGSVLQEWRDTDRDGRADVVNFYSGGRLVQSIGGR